MAAGPFSISYSKVAAYRQCRKRYWFKYVSGLEWPPEPPNPGGLIGTAVHQAMRVLAETRKRHLGRNEIEVYLRMPGHEIAGPGTEFYDTAMSLYEAGCDVHDSIPSAACWTEKDMRHASKHGIELTARVDRIDRLQSGEWQVIDWKTGYDQDEWTDEQLDIAHVAARSTARIPREAEVTAIAWNLREKLRSPVYRPRTRRLRRNDAIATVEKYRAMAEELQSTVDFPAMPGRYCSFCEWRAQCPEGNELATADWEDD